MLRFLVLYSLNCFENNLKLCALANWNWLNKTFKRRNFLWCSSLKL